MSNKAKLGMLAVLLCSVMGSAMAVETTITEDTLMPAAEGGFTADQIQPLTQVSQAAPPPGSVTSTPAAPVQPPADLNSYNGGTPMPGTPAAAPVQPSGVMPSAPKVMPGDSTTVVSPANPIANPNSPLPPPINTVPGAAVPNSVSPTQQPVDNTLPPKPQIAPPM